MEPESQLADAGGGMILPDVDALLPDLGDAGEAEPEQGAAEPASGRAEDARVEVDTPALDIDQVVPALLSVERRKQHATACQYWLKLENRMPFRIRNLALRFSAYMVDENYDEPVLFDSEVRSFSELRPTDSQYRDLFFEHVGCEELAFIKVQDAGRCSAGTLNKFSTQSGDCIRFVEVAPSAMVCIFVDDGSENARPCGEVGEDQVDALLARFVAAYRAGDMDAFLELFDRQVETAEGFGRDRIEAKYDALFASGKDRDITIDSREWRPLAGGAAEIRFSATPPESAQGGFFNRMFASGADASLVAEMKVRGTGDGLVIGRYFTKDGAN